MIIGKYTNEDKEECRADLWKEQRLETLKLNNHCLNFLGMMPILLAQETMLSNSLVITQHMPKMQPNLLASIS